MRSATEHDTRNQPLAEFQQPPVTGVCRAPAAENVASPSSELPQEMARFAELPYHDARKQAIEAFEHLYLSSLLERCGGNVTHCARTAGVDRVYLHRLLRKHGLRGAKQRPHPMNSLVVPKFEGAEHLDPLAREG